MESNDDNPSRLHPSLGESLQILPPPPLNFVIVD